MIALIILSILMTVLMLITEPTGKLSQRVQVIVCGLCAVIIGLIVMVL